MISNEKLIGFVKAQPVSVACGVLTILLGVGIYFRSDYVADAERVLEEKIALGERIDANLKNGVQLPEQLTALSNSRQQIETRLVRPDELAKNQQIFYKLEADTGIKLVEIRQSPVPPAVMTARTAAKANYFPVGYFVAARGDYNHLIDFLRRIESGQRFSRIISASISLAGSTNKDRSTGELMLNLSLELLGQP
ncbi:MAG: hypothetical protein JSR48_00880 [Verrucomicrobia bacterium]|nr:hypothetical protein [Verrucomicrobiota bacterium]